MLSQKLSISIQPPDLAKLEVIANEMCNGNLSAAISETIRQYVAPQQYNMRMPRPGRRGPYKRRDVQRVVEAQ